VNENPYDIKNHMFDLSKNF